jgi:mRNA-degrading endonuclease RelE of RelBE toxin-antitoxin system
VHGSRFNQPPRARASLVCQKTPGTAHSSETSPGAPGLANHRILPPHAAYLAQSFRPVIQIVFNEISAAEMASLPKDLQLDLLAQFDVLPEDLDALDPERFGVLDRDGEKLYRYRAKDYRIYFAKSGEGIVVHRVLHKNTIRDFLFRSKLPMPAEDEALARQKAFWKLIEEAETARRR